MMRKICLLLLLACLFAAVPVLAETGELPEWTVLFYLCGSDLESRHGFASGIISAISECVNPVEALEIFERIVDPKMDVLERKETEQVNVVIETGGSEEWDSEKAGVTINEKSLQRWSYVPGKDYIETRVRLEQELPLQSMADPETLSDFIRWGTQAYPAKKYALVLWGHGDGAKTGILNDELFDNDVMILDELRQALNDGGVFFEALLLDACMMANLETACAVQKNAAWMIASEEMVPGRGTAVDNWLQELYNYPRQNGKMLGRNICEMTQNAYANTDDEQSNSIITCSVIDLSKIDRVNALADQFFKLILDTYINHPSRLSIFTAFMYEAEEYGDSMQNMRDIGSIFYRTLSTLLMGEDLRNDMIDALNEAVVYAVRGPGRSAARGLSFCYATDFSNEELDIYARNCMSPHYLEFLDAITPWSAPDWIYETVEVMPEIETLREYRLVVEKCMTVQDVPGFSIRSDMQLDSPCYTLYQMDEDTEQKIRLGRTMCRSYEDDQGRVIWSAVEPWLWPSIDGEFCSIDLISNVKAEDYFSEEEIKQALYSVPIQIGPNTWNLRYGRQYQLKLPGMAEEVGKVHPSQYTVYGLWEGYDDDTKLLSRNVKSLSQLAGQEYQLLYPVDESGISGKTEYIIGEKHTLHRALDIEAQALPAGTYYLQYEVLDMFMRPIPLETIELVWDGETLSFPEGFSWEGTSNLRWAPKS